VRRHLILVVRLHMYNTHPDIVTPEDDTTLWRYINLEKLLSLLATQEIFLCRIDKFKDPWEGSWPQSTLEAIDKNWSSEAVQNFKSITEAMKSAHFLSCWHKSKHESAALWEQYSGKSGIAIRTTVAKLRASITGNYRFYIGQVEYIDFPTAPSPTMNLMNPVFKKRQSFEHEKEVRLLVSHIAQQGENLDWENQYEYLTLKVDLVKLIDCLYVSPQSPDWVVDSIKDLLGKYKMSNVSVVKSMLYSPAIQ
jgi:hypothetical protein